MQYISEEYEIAISILIDDTRSSVMVNVNSSEVLINQHAGNMNSIEDSNDNDEHDLIIELTFVVRVLATLLLNAQMLKYGSST